MATTKTKKASTTAKKKTVKVEVTKEATTTSILTKEVPTVEQAISKLMIIHNNYQQYRKEQEKSYKMTTKEIATAYAKHIKPEQLKALIVAVYTINSLQDDLHAFTVAWYKVHSMNNNAEYQAWLNILATDLHPTDLPKEG